VPVDTEVKTCYVVYIQIPMNLEAEASVHMADTERLDMRFSSKTKCDVGPTNNGFWQTDLEFKTYVHCVYHAGLDLITIIDDDDATIIPVCGYCVS
jgi:hypothetical protein